jgi:hypothetical protein
MGKIYQNGNRSVAIKYTKIGIKIPNGHRKPQIFQPKAFKNRPKLAFLVLKETIRQP